MAASERVNIVTNLYEATDKAKLTIESQMDDMIQNGVTVEMSKILLDIVEAATKLLKDSPSLAAKQ